MDDQQKVVKTDPPQNADTPKAVVNARKEKRLKWWYESMNRRLENPENPETKPGKKAAFQAEGAEKKKKFAVFVGQIPFDAKEEEVKKLFEDVAKPGQLKSFRWRINPKTKKFSGFAFVEFENKGAFRRAFELHHTLINGRPINVEATSAGGKKSKFRKEKIKERTVTFQKKAQETIERKARDAAKRKAKPPSTDINVVDSAEPQENSEQPAAPNNPKNRRKKRQRDTDGTEQPPPKKRPQDVADPKAAEDSEEILSQKSQEKTAAKEFLDGAKKNTSLVASDDKRDCENGGKKGESQQSGIKNDGNFESNLEKPKPFNQKKGFAGGAEDGSSWKNNKRKEGYRKKNSQNEVNLTSSEKGKSEPRPADVSQVSWVKPKQAHLACLVKPRLHIKFD